MRKLICNILSILVLLLSFAFVAETYAAVVINEVYANGGNAGATYNRDFVELYNNGITDENVSGYSIQYINATGTGNFNVTALNTAANPIIAPGGYFLITFQTGANGTTIANGDVNNTGINFSGTGGRIALVNGTTALSGATANCATNLSTSVDFVGYGNANCFEGANPAPTQSATTSDQRSPNGTDTNNNSVDFIGSLPTPRLAPTAAGTTAGGRVTEARGRGIFRALVTMTDSQGNQRTAYTNQQGFYQFEDVAGGQVYVFTAQHRRYSFDQPTQVQFIGEEENGINFVGSPYGIFRYDPWNLPTKGVR